jgi:hypothetical protein
MGSRAPVGWLHVGPTLVLCTRTMIHPHLHPLHARPMGLIISRLVPSLSRQTP